MIFKMAGNINSPSVIWVAGEVSGVDETGTITPIPSDITPAGLATAAYVDLVASGVQSDLDALELVAATVTYTDYVASGVQAEVDALELVAATESYADYVASGVQSNLDILIGQLTASGII